MKKFIILICATALLFSCTKEVKQPEEVATAKGGKKNSITQTALAPSVNFTAVATGSNVSITWNLQPDSGTVIKWVGLYYQHNGGPLWTFTAPWDLRWVEYTPEYWAYKLTRTEGWPGTYRYALHGSYGEPGNSLSSIPFWVYSNEITIP